jgi:hypothetical protein
MQATMLVQTMMQVVMQMTMLMQTMMQTTSDCGVHDSHNGNGCQWWIP